jgi:hypothetical protein
MSIDEVADRSRTYLLEDQTVEHILYAMEEVLAEECIRTAS